MNNNSYKCPICLQKVKNYMCSDGTCNHDFCFECIVKWLFQNFTCPIDRTPVTNFKIRKKFDDKLLYKDDAVIDFESLKEKIISAENIVGTEFIYKLRKSEPGLFWIVNPKLNEALLIKMFQKYGDVASIIEKENCCYVHFFDIIQRSKMVSDISINYFKMEEFDMNCFNYIC